MKYFLLSTNFVKDIPFTRRVMLVLLAAVSLGVLLLAPFGAPFKPTAYEKTMPVHAVHGSTATVVDQNISATTAKHTYKTPDMAVDTMGYLVRHGHVVEVPRQFQAKLSDDLAVMKNVANRQDAFVQAMLPHILGYNEAVNAQREKLLTLQEKRRLGHSLSRSDVKWLAKITAEYKLNHASIPELLKRVDAIPPSLALAQAVVESGWGVDKNARHVNSPFGMMRSSTKLLSYDSLYESVKSYIHNLNTHGAYEKMRVIRAAQRSKGEPLCSHKLVGGLHRYSELGQGYINRVRKIIDAHQLKRYDAAQLRDMYYHSNRI